MNLKKLLVIVVGICILAGVAIFFSSQKDKVVKTVVYPEDKMFSSDSGQILSVYFIENVEDSEMNHLTESNKMYIEGVGGENTRLEAEYVNTTLVRKNINLNNEYFFEKKLDVKITASTNQPVDGASLIIEFPSGSKSRKLSLGNLSFQTNTEKDNSMEDLVVSGITPLIIPRGEGGVCGGFIMKLDVKKKLSLVGFDNGFTDYGVQKIYVSDKGYESILENDRILSKDFPQLFLDETTEKVSPKSNVVNLEKGKKTIIIKFSKTNKATNLFNCGGQLKYSINGKQKGIYIENSERFESLRDYSKLIPKEANGEND